MWKITPALGAFSLLAVISSFAIPTAAPAVPVVAPNAVTAELPVEKSAYVYRGRRVCFYRNGWHGPGYYLCKRPRSRGFYLAPRFFRYGFRHERRLRHHEMRVQGRAYPHIRFGRHGLVRNGFARNGFNRTGIAVTRGARVPLHRGPGAGSVSTTRPVFRNHSFGPNRLNSPAANPGRFNLNGRTGGIGGSVGGGSIGTNRIGGSGGANAGRIGGAGGAGGLGSRPGGGVGGGHVGGAGMGGGGMGGGGMGGGHGGGMGGGGAGAH